MPDFEVITEYYMHIDPAISIHAVKNFDKVEMSVIWTKNGEEEMFITIALATI